MTVRDAINKLERIVMTHGDSVELYFDCPACRTTFTLGWAVEEPKTAVIIQPEPKRKP